MTTVKGKHIVVIGAARSGLAASCLLATHGADVLLTEGGLLPVGAAERLKKAGIRYEDNGHTLAAMNGEFAVVSPGVPDEAPIVQEYLKQGKAVYSELEVASWFNKGRMIAVTGSNGKTTTATWLAHTWKTAGIPYLLAGNIGTAYSDMVSETTENTSTILEVSSFQLDHISSFRPDVSILLNITPDHLNRYQYKFENYIRSKFRITEFQREGDVLIYWNDDPVISKYLSNLSHSHGKPRFLPFSDSVELKEGAFVRDNNIIIKIDQKEEHLMHVDQVGLRGRHNLHNSMAAALAARASEIRLDHIRDSLMKFEGVEHRLELARELDGVKYINDSKATNVNAVWYALDSYKVPMVLILGGRDKGNDYAELIPQIKEKVHTIIAIGEGRKAIEEQLKAHVPNFIVSETMEEAVRNGRKLAKRGEIVMLSPACASFDMFENYEHRGKEFKKFVNQL